MEKTNSTTTNNVEDQTPSFGKGCGFIAHPATQELFAKSIDKEVKRCNGTNPFWENIFRMNSATKKHANTPKVKIAETTNNRCDACKKRIRLIGFMCKCGGVYCGSHRYPEVHSCCFDHKTLGGKALSKSPYASACKAAKLIHI